MRGSESERVKIFRERGGKLHEMRLRMCAFSSVLITWKIKTSIYVLCIIWALMAHSGRKLIPIAICQISQINFHLSRLMHSRFNYDWISIKESENFFSLYQLWFSKRGNKKEMEGKSCERLLCYTRWGFNVLSLNEFSSSWFPSIHRWAREFLFLNFYYQYNVK